MEPVIQAAQKAGNKLEIHHLVPLEHAHLMGSSFDPNDVKNLAGVDPETHKDINRAWNKFRSENKDPSFQKIMEQVAEINKKYGKNFHKIGG